MHTQQLHAFNNARFRNTPRVAQFLRVCFPKGVAPEDFEHLLTVARAADDLATSSATNVSGHSVAAQPPAHRLAGLQCSECRRTLDLPSSLSVETGICDRCRMAQAIEGTGAAKAPTQLTANPVTRLIRAPVACSVCGLARRLPSDETVRTGVCLKCREEHTQ